MDDLDNLPEDDDQSEESPTFRELRKQRDEAVKEAKEAAAKVRTAEMKAAIASSGINLDAKTRFFLDHYEGEPDADSIKAALSEHGFLEEQKPEVPTAEIQAHAEISEAQSGTQAPGLNEDAHYEELRRLYQESSPNVDPRQLTEQANAIMQKYGQKIVIDEGVR